jgi:replicative DNA helicase
VDLVNDRCYLIWCESGAIEQDADMVCLSIVLKYYKNIVKVDDLNMQPLIGGWCKYSENIFAKYRGGSNNTAMLKWKVIRQNLME